MDLKTIRTFILPFNPTQIKSIFNTEFDPSNPDIRYEKTAARWYSQMQDFLEKKLPGKSSPAQLKQMLTSWANKGEFKQDELEWSGVLDWLDSQDGKVSKQDVLNYLEQNNLRVEEVVKGEGLTRQQITVLERYRDEREKVTINATWRTVSHFREGNLLEEIDEKCKEKYGYTDEDFKTRILWR